jgi:hypothetical protein
VKRKLATYPAKGKSEEGNKNPVYQLSQRMRKYHKMRKKRRKRKRKMSNSTKHKWLL